MRYQVSRLVQAAAVVRPRPEYRSIVVLDMVGSGRWDDRTQLRARAVLDRMVRNAVRAAGIARWRLVTEDRGDGMIMLIPADVSKVDLLDPLVPHLLAQLRDHNSFAGPRIRLRVAVHAGEMLRSPAGWVGTDINLANRLVNSKPLYEQLVRLPWADLVLIVSGAIHNAVIRHGYPGIDPDDYAKVRVVSKEVATDAWVHVPRLSVPAAEAPGMWSRH